jgi:hypothetical protein
VRSSFDTTINVLDGLLEFERATGGPAQMRTARRSGEQYPLERGLFRRKSTGAVVQPAYLEFAFPYYWHYDVLRALDYFRRSGAGPDPRMAEAIAVVQSKRQPGGRWLLDRIHPGRVHFDLEGGVGTPSRWNTLRALRVLKWWGVAFVVAGSVVGHGEAQGSVLGLNGDAGLCCMGVLAGVLERFEAAEVHGRLGVLAEAPSPSGATATGKADLLAWAPSAAARPRSASSGG